MKSIRFLLLLTIGILSFLPISAFQGGYGPYFPNFKSQYVVKGLILNSSFFYHASYANVDLYSLEVIILNDFDLIIKDTITLLPDTTDINKKEYMGETGSHIKEGQEYYMDIRINKYDQMCYVFFMPIDKGKVLGNLTNWNEFWLRSFNISPRGMSIDRFERKLKKKLDKENTNRIKQNNMP